MLVTIFGANLMRWGVVACMRRLLHRSTRLNKDDNSEPGCATEGWIVCKVITTIQSGPTRLRWGSTRTCVRAVSHGAVFLCGLSWVNTVSVTHNPSASVACKFGRRMCFCNRMVRFAPFNGTYHPITKFRTPSIISLLPKQPWKKAILSYHYRRILYKNI